MLLSIYFVRSAQICSMLLIIRCAYSIIGATDTAAIILPMSHQLSSGHPCVDPQKKYVIIIKTSLLCCRCSVLLHLIGHTTYFF